MNLLRILITGSREWKDVGAIHAVINRERETAQREKKVLLVTHGDAYTGADSIAEKYCRETGIHTAPVKARWHVGKSAGPIRNHIMVEMGQDRGYAFSNDIDDLTKKSGTRECYTYAVSRGIPMEKIT